MADKEEGESKDPFVEVGFVLLVIAMLWMMWSAIFNYLVVDRYGSLGNLWQIILDKLARSVYPIAIIVSIIISALALVGIVWLWKKLMDLEKEERAIYGTADVSLKEKFKSEAPKKNDRWEHALEHLNSPNAGDWRLAIIEADVMLDELLRTLGYQGDSIGDMLKGVDKSDMLSLEAAWEAHKVRNQIVHSASEYHLTEREAKRVMSLYEQVFREFQVI